MSNLIATDLQTQEVDSELIHLFEIELKNGTILYFHPGVDDDLTDIQFNDKTSPFTARTYEPFPIMMDGLELSADGAQNRPSFTIANIGNLFSTELGDFKNDDLIGQRLKKRTTLRKYLVGESAHTTPPIEFRTQEYIIDRIAEENSTSITFEVAAPFDIENVKLPRRVVVGKFCSWKYQGYHNATNPSGGCTWKLDGSIKYRTASGTFSHNAYFDINDSPLVPSGETYAAYSASTAYTTVDYVTHDNRFWLCIVAGTGNTPSSTSAFWKEVFKYTTHSTSSVSYTKDALVLFGGTVWKALRAHTSAGTNTPDSVGSPWVRADVCGKTLQSCKCRFGFKPNDLTGASKKPDGSKNLAARLPFGSFPGTLKF